MCENYVLKIISLLYFTFYILRPLESSINFINLFDEILLNLLGTRGGVKDSEVTLYLEIIIMYVSKLIICPISDSKYLS